MNVKRFRPSVVLAGCALLIAGCASGASEAGIQGGAVSDGRRQVETASAAEQAQACLLLCRKLWDRDALESLRYLRKGSELRDAECCRQYLASAESASVNLSQRLYARLFLEGLLRKGPLFDRGGRDARGDLYIQLCLAWRYTEPVCIPKARQVLEAFLESGAGPAPVGSTAVAQLMREFGLRSEDRPARARRDVQLYAAEAADDSRRWLQVPVAADRTTLGDWTVVEANAWGGGTDRLFQSTRVLAFLVNARGEPSFRGDHLWICNLGSLPVYLTSLAVGQNSLELLPGREEMIPLATNPSKHAETTTGIPLNVRYRRQF